jgi:cellulose synthase/poly-beta-1,6-N-acetylglucosamine synthase-like glycosyltransferase
MIKETLEAVRNLEYKHFEVLILDNNSSGDEWKEIQKYISSLKDSRISFFHEEVIPGFKAGALKYLLNKTSPKASIIWLLDADYQVEKDWLCSTVGLFENEEIWAVQCPQAHRCDFSDEFQTAMHDELDLFFHQGMITRNAVNAAILHGTMVLLRRKDLNAVWWWNVGHICEDTDLGIRLQRAGKRIQYVHHVFGKGTLPGNYQEFKKQRFRWAYGWMLLFRDYWKDIFFGKNFSLAQKYEYFLGWLVWWGTVFFPVFFGIGIVGSIFIHYDSRYHLPYEFSFIILGYVLAVWITTISVYNNFLKISLKRILHSMLLSASLTFTLFW